MNKLIFLTDNLLSPTNQANMRLPLSFITFGIIKAKMYSYFRNKDTFITENVTRKWGNSVVYGALFVCQDFDFYSRILDSYYMCSMSTLLRNHQNDIFHRVNVDVVPITFDRFDDLQRLKYKEGESISSLTYVANQNHPKINKRIKDMKNTYRIVDGINKENFYQLFWEVTR